jgi:hypothetical protein
MRRTVAGIVAGLFVWVVVATVVNLLFRALWPGYAEVELAMKFTFAMLIGRLLLGALSALCAGIALAWIAKENATRAAIVLGAALTILFVPIHYQLWGDFPIVYHLIFLLSLLPATFLGARLRSAWSS